MELKDYQQRALKQVENYLSHLAEWKKKSIEIAKVDPEASLDFPAKAWSKLSGLKKYQSKENNIGQPVPNFCLKIPTGGGKTLLAVKSIDLINTEFLHRQTGLVLWIVPTTQIYNQTYASLKDRGHPYRQHLDIASGNRTLILEKTDLFSPQDVTENLVIMLLMLPSATRENKETLKVFKDSGGFQNFFPLEDDIEGHKRLLGKFPNLDHFGTDNDFWHKQVKTSLGNTLRLLSPIIILDEGHKAYSEKAQSTLYGFNPSIIVELSATPKADSNVLVDIRGRELDQEGMIKLDLHIRNQQSPDWKDTLQASIEHLDYLNNRAEKYYAESGVYIRPIMLIQVERTGKEKRDDSRYTHADQIKDYLISHFGIAPEEVAIKTSEKDELKEIDDVGGLLSDQCRVRFIITKQALQEGWDCPFAYVLTILTNPSSKTALTQLVGRVLRQPYARKTTDRALNESYVYTYQRKAGDVLANIKTGFEQDGLGDLAGRVSEENSDMSKLPLVEVNIRPQFKNFAQTFCLPLFAVKSGKKDWRPISYEMDIASRIDWDKASISPLTDLILSDDRRIQYEMNVKLGDDLYGHDDFIAREIFEQTGYSKYDPAFMARQLSENVVSNPWIAYDFSQSVLNPLTEKYGQETVAQHFIYIVQETKKHLSKEKDRLAHFLFKEMLDKDELRFMVIANGFDITAPKKAKAGKQLTRVNGSPLQASLFDYMMEDDFNSLEKDIACFLDEQKDLFFWYRNVSKQDYSVQGWQRGAIYPDFIFAKNTNDNNSDAKVYIVESKGIHLENQDTAYKQAVFEICNQNANVKQTDMASFSRALKQRTTQFEVVYGDEWQQRLSEMMA